MLDKKDTLILFGRSPYINEIREYIPEIIKKYTTMGCNYFCESFPDVDYVVFYDNLAPEVKNSTIVTQVKYFKQPGYNAYKKYPDYPKKELYVVVKNDYIFTSMKNALYFHFHTPSMALNWAWQKGFKNVVLIGIDLINNTPHFDKDTAPDINTPRWFDTDLVKARRHIKEVAGRYLNIYKVNPKSDIDVDLITIDDLLREDILIKKEREFTTMEKVQIKVKSDLMIDGNIATAGSIKEVNRVFANELLARGRAEIYTGETIKTEEKAPTAEYDLEKLKEVAAKLELKHNPNISGKTLNDKILKFLVEKDEELKDETNAINAYESYEAKNKPADEDGENITISFEELLNIAKEAEIEHEDNVSYDELKGIIEVNLEQYASELKLEVAENSNIKEVWGQIKEKLANNDD